MLKAQNTESLYLKELKEIWFHLTYKCNLSCNHCLFNCSPGKPDQELSLFKIQQNIKEALNLGIKEIYLTGGEPLLWQPMEEFLAWYYEKENPPLTILTNGTLIDEKWAQLFTRYIDKELKIRISLECYSKETNDEWRGNGSFVKTITGIRLLNDKNIKPWIAFTNKSGGNLEFCQGLSLEKEFKTRLIQDCKVEIAGLKIISAYSKGRHNIKLDTNNGANNKVNLNDLQCTYGVALSSEGFAPCPVLVDIKESFIKSSLNDLIGRKLVLDYPYCESCLLTGTTCGN